MLSKLGCFQLKIGCHNSEIFDISFTIPKKEKPVVDTQRIKIRTSKYAATKSHQIIKEESKKEEGNKGTTKQSENNEQNGNSKSFSPVHFSRSVMSDSLQPHEVQHDRPPCPSPTPGVYPNPCPLRR